MERPTTPATVLIVDDAPANLTILTQALRSEFDIRIATSGADALRLVAGNAPDLILLDIVMPGMDGYDVCRRLKSQPSTCNIPIIFLTAKGEVAEETLGLTLGAVDYITKPFTVPIVQARVRTHVELKRRGDLLESLSMRDGLTGIPNRRQFDTFLTRAWRQALRHGTPLSLVMADIDYFKNYNDTYGHIGGDECLRAVAVTLSTLARRPGDLAARFGGEEFAVVLENTPIAGAMHLAESMRLAIAALGLDHETSPIGNHVTITLGAASIIPDHGQQPDMLISMADAKLYEAKQAGRNRVLGASL